MATISVDFGTTNTVVAAWRPAAQQAETLHLPGLSVPADPPLVPSLLYIADGRMPQVQAGQAVRAAGLDARGDARFFAGMKRSIGARTRLPSREIDGVLWGEAEAGAAFLQTVLAAAREHEGEPLTEVVLTVPVQSFEQYLRWLQGGVALVPQTADSPPALRIVDESTAAALGYGVTAPGELVLVVDFGGGTLDVSLVRMPEAAAEVGVMLGAQRSAYEPGAAEARVIAKAGRVLGGEDIDHWLLDEVLAQAGASRGQVGAAYDRLKQAAEAAKIRLSTHEAAEISVFDPDALRTYRATFTRSQLEDLLDAHGFYESIQQTLGAVLRGARVRGIFAEDIEGVLLIGGSSQIPSVRRLIRSQFGARVHDERPFEAVAHGALQLAAGLGLDDYLYHSYGIRHLSPITMRHEWEEFIPAGTRYPLDRPVEIVLAASRDGQPTVELVIGELSEQGTGLSEVMFGERSILMVDGSFELREVVPLNDADGARTVAVLDPPGRVGEDRIRVVFDVDANRLLRVTVSDLQTGHTLLHRAPVAELR